MLYLKHFSNIVLLCTLATQVSSIIVKCGHECKCNFVIDKQNDNKEEATIECLMEERLEEAIFTEDLLSPSNFGLDSFVNVVIFVSIENIDHAYIDEKFLKKWKAFPSGSIDAFNVGELEFSNQNLTIEDDGLQIKQNIGLQGTKVTSIPKNFLTASEVIIKMLDYSYMSNLDLSHLLVDSLTFKCSNNSEIGTIKKSKSYESFFTKNMAFEFHDCIIGTVKKDSLYFDANKVELDFYQSKIGIFESKSLNISGHTNLKMEHCKIGIIEKEGIISDDPENEIIIGDNVMGVELNSLNIKCDKDLIIIEGNIIIPRLSIDSYCTPKDNGTCDTDLSESEFIDSSCKKNSVPSLSKIPTPAPPITNNCPEPKPVTTTEKPNIEEVCKPLIESAVNEQKENCTQSKPKMSDKLIMEEVITKEKCQNFIEDALNNVTIPLPCDINPNMTLNSNSCEINATFCQPFIAEALNKSNSGESKDYVEVSHAHVYLTSSFIVFLILVIACFIIHRLRQRKRNQMRASFHGYN